MNEYGNDKVPCVWWVYTLAGYGQTRNTNQLA